MSVRTVRPEELGEQLTKPGAVLVDVRTPAEFAEIHIEGAKNIPLDRLDASQLLREHPGPLMVVCRSGSRGRQACEKLVAAGGGQVANVEGGTLACEQAGLRVVRGKKMMSLERQVRIAAGFLVAVGAILALTVHPYCVGLSLFVGCGLMFAGITDTCGMGIMIAQMPWNQRSETCKV